MCQCCPHCCANQLTCFYMRATLALNGLKRKFGDGALLLFLSVYLPTGCLFIPTENSRKPEVFGCLHGLLKETNC